MSRRPAPVRSPFAGASKRHLRDLRMMAGAVRRWELDVRENGYCELPSFSSVDDIFPGHAFYVAAGELERRALLRLFALPQGPQIQEDRRIEFLKQDRRAYEAHCLREEVKVLSERLATVEQAAAAEQAPETMPATRG